MIKVHFVWAAFFIAVFSACQGGEQGQPPTPSPVSPIQSVEPDSIMHAPANHEQAGSALSVTRHGQATEISRSSESNTSRLPAGENVKNTPVEAQRAEATKTVSTVTTTNTTGSVKKFAVSSGGMAKPVPSTPAARKTPAKTRQAGMPKPMLAVTPPNIAIAAKKAAPIFSGAKAKSTQLAVGDSTKGKVLARKCSACHNFGPKKKVGPGLGAGNGVPGIYGRKAGTSPGFKYKFTRYIKGEAWVWDDNHLAAWLCDSKLALRTFTANTSAKTKMPKQKICDPDSQADIIAYLKTL